MAQKSVWRTTHEKEFVQVFQDLSVRMGPWRAWSDFITVTAIAFANFFEPNSSIKTDREGAFQSIMKAYTDDERKKIESLAQITVSAYEQNPQQDFLGELYMRLDFGDSWHGQYFTPWPIAYVMAQMTLGPEKQQLDEKGYISVCDPACGAGCMLLAAAATYQDSSDTPTYQDDVLFVGQDLDRNVALMCYIQLSIRGCAGYVAIGDSLVNPVSGHDLFPAIGDGGELWFTPYWYSPVWTFRRLKLLAEYHAQEANQYEHNEEQVG